MGSHTLKNRARSPSNEERMTVSPSINREATQTFPPARVPPAYQRPQTTQPRQQKQEKSSGTAQTTKTLLINKAMANSLPVYPPFMKNGGNLSYDKAKREKLIKKKE